MENRTANNCEIGTYSRYSNNKHPVIFFSLHTAMSLVNHSLRVPRARLIFYYFVQLILHFSNTVPGMCRGVRVKGYASVRGSSESAQGKLQLEKLESE